MTSLFSDLKFAFRRLAKRPVASVAAVATIAVGLAGATALFTIVDAVLLRHLPFRDPSRLVAIWATNPAWKKNPILATKWDRLPVSVPEYRALRESGAAFDDVAIWSEESLPLELNGQVDYVRTTKASWTMLPLLGITPLVGRSFTQDEDLPNARPVALLGEETWRSRYGAAHDIIGRTIELDHTPFVIIGIVPHGLSLDPQRDFASGSYGGTSFTEFWIPAGHDTTEYDDATRQNYQLLARLKPRVSVSWAEQIAQQVLQHTSQEGAKRGARIVLWKDDLTQTARGPLLILFASTCFLLLVACVNVALLNLGESMSRNREMAMRAALGASRARLMTQLVAESFVTCCVGAALAIPLAFLAVRLLLAAAPLQLVAMVDLQPDVGLLLFGFAIIVASALVTGAIPALVMARVQPASVIKSGVERTTAQRQPVQQFLIGLQVAVAIVLLIGAALLSRTSQLIGRVNPGFDARNLLVIDPIAPTEMWVDPVRIQLTYSEILTRLSAVPGIAETTGISQPPIVGTSSVTKLTIEGEQQISQQLVQYRAIVPHYFGTMHIPLRSGREFTPDDKATADAVAIVSVGMARRDFPRISPIGMRVKLFGKWRRIVGLVDDVHFTRLSEDVAPTIYLPFAQSGSWQLSLILRTRDDPAAIAHVVRDVIRETAPAMGIRRIDVMTTALRRTYADERYRSLLMSLFSVVATFLAAIGTYGVTARSVRDRRREAAIRLSVGASTRSITRLLMSPTAKGVIWGSAVGVLAALVAEPRLRPYLFQLDPTNPLVYGAIVLAVGLLGLGTTWLAVRRISKVDPAAVLRID